MPSKLAGEARSFRHPRSPLERALNNLLLILVAVIVPLGLVLGYALYHRHTPLQRRGTDGGRRLRSRSCPEGLILLDELDLRRRRAAHDTTGGARPAAERARVAGISRSGLYGQDGNAHGARAEGARCGAGGRDDQGRARGGARPLRGERSQPDLDAGGDPRPRSQRRGSSRLPEVPFSSSRRWSAIEVGHHKYVLGAPELFPLDGLKERAESEAAEGRRVVAIGTTIADVEHAKPEDGPPLDLHPIGIVVHRRAAPSAGPVRPSRISSPKTSNFASFPATGRRPSPRSPARPASPKRSAARRPGSSRREDRAREGRARRVGDRTDLARGQEEASSRHCARRGSTSR